MPHGDGSGGGPEGAALLRLVACGSVDDGKSTLIGRLLHDTRSLLHDTLEGVVRSSRKRGAHLDLSLVTDGLEAEREQGITIDVAYRSFATPRRGFVLADAPGHVQYTRNMVTAASTADAAVLLVDVTRGVTEQTRRHAAVLATVGVDAVVVAVNKLDAVDWSFAAYAPVRDQAAALLDSLRVAHRAVVPLSALTGENVVEQASTRADFPGPTLLHVLEQLTPRAPRDADGPLRLPIQRVCRPRAPNDPVLRDYRGLMGRIDRGRVAVGDELVVLPRGLRSIVVGLERAGDNVDSAVAGDPVTVRLRDELDVSRGDVLVGPSDCPPARTTVHARVCWMGQAPARVGRTLSLRHGASELRATIASIGGRLDLDGMVRVPADRLDQNDLGWVELRTTRAVYADAFAACRATGAFILVDPEDYDTVAACCVEV